MVNVELDAELELINPDTKQTEFVRIYIPKISKTGAEQFIKNTLCQIPSERMKNSKFKMFGLSKWLLVCGTVSGNKTSEIDNSEFNYKTVIPQNSNCKYMFLRPDGTFRVEYPYISTYVTIDDTTADFLNKLYADEGKSYLNVSTTRFSKKFKVAGETAETESGIIIPIEIEIQTDICTTKNEITPCEIDSGTQIYVTFQKTISKESADWDFFN